MKRLLVVLILSVLGASCEQLFRLGGGGPKKTAREIQGLNGPVRSVSIAIAVPVNKSGGWEPGEQKPVSVDAYDKRGNRTERTLYTTEGMVSNKILFTYDERGNEIEIAHYDANGAPESRTVSAYNTEGRKTESRWYATDGTLTRRTVFTYDAHGNEISARSDTPEGALETSTALTYDAMGNLEEASWSYPGGKQGGQIVYRRDAKGALLSSVEFAYAPDGTLQSRTDTTYDTRGNPMEVVWYGEGGRFKKRETSTYRYDVFGNWTQRTTTNWVTAGSSSSFEPPVATYRTVTYYGRKAE